MPNDPIYLEKSGAIARLILNRPEKLNALNREIWEAIPDLMADVNGDGDIKVVIVQGATADAFAAGADIGEFRDVHATAESARDYHGRIRQAYDALATVDRPTIAMIQGICFGGGCALALCCDLRYADTASRFCIPPAKLGIAYSLHETKRLMDLVGPSRTKQMLMGAKVVEAEEALQIGLITGLFAPEALERETLAFATQLSELSQYTIRAVKKIAEEILHGAADDTEQSRELSRGAFEGPDYLEGREAFLQKRPARFTYR